MEGLATKLSHMKSYLQFHFYYLINPVDVNKWCFLTYRPASNCEHLRVLVDQKQKQSITDFKDWDVERTYFRSEEILPFIACQSIICSSSFSIPAAFQSGIKIVNADPKTSGRTPNLSQNPPLSGEELEVLSSVCIIDASQHKIGSRYSNFGGQDGKSFLTNLIGNLVDAKGFSRADKVNLNCDIIGDFLDFVHVPFLFPANMKLPEFFKSKLSKPEGFNSRTVNFGEFGRTRNASEIDGIFNYFIKNGANRSPSVGICSVECKNWQRNLLFKDLILILEKALKNSAKISLIFCNSLGASKDKNLKSFADYCNENEFLVLKLKNNKVQQDFKLDFKLEPYCRDLPSCFKSVCIIIELNVINADRT